MTTPVDQHLIVKSNALIQASYKLSLNEQRLVLLAVAGLNSKRPGVRPGFNQVDDIRIRGSKPEPPKIPSADQRGLSRARSMG